MYVLIIGFGSIGKRHYENLVARGGVKVGVFDTDSARLKSLGLPPHLVFDTFEKAQASNPDVAFICTPPSLHLPYALAMAKQGCHLFVEKPFSHSLGDLDVLFEEVKKRKLVFLLGSNWKFHVSFQKMKILLDAGVLGRILSARFCFGSYLPSWRPGQDYRQGYGAKQGLGGGVLLDAHSFDYARWFLGEMKEIFCLAEKVSPLEIETEDIAEVIMRTEQGTVVTLHRDYFQQPYRKTCEFFGEKGSMVWSFEEKQVKVYEAEKREWKSYAEPEGYSINQMYLDELDHFFDSIQGSSSPLTTLEDAVQVLALILMAKESAQQKRLLPLSSPYPTGKKVVAIIQARMSSARLPEKVLKVVQKKPLLEHLVERVQRAAMVHQVVVATSTEGGDDPIFQWATEKGLACFRGSLDDVLDRYYHAAQHYDADVVVRITGDCPLMDPALIDRSVVFFLSGGYDYVSTAKPVPTFPDGLDIEVFSFDALQCAHRQVRLASEREHVTPFLWKHPALFYSGTITHSPDLSKKRWTLDEPADYLFVAQVYDALFPEKPDFTMQDVLDFLVCHPEIEHLNENIGRDEGYVQSLRKDDVVDAF